MYIANSNDCVDLGKHIYRNFEKEDRARYAMFFNGDVGSSKCENEGDYIAKNQAVFLLNGAYALLQANKEDKTIFFIACYALIAIEISLRYCYAIEGGFKEKFDQELMYHKMLFYLFKANKFVQKEVEIWAALCSIWHGAFYLSNNAVDVIDIVSFRSEANTYLIFEEMTQAAKNFFYKEQKSKQKIFPSNVVKSVFRRL